ncbi:probable ATP-dependent RNA helicase Dbp73D [Phymastichus coffea]|uniref:probable ATP-dependent RNA helicase Dbp73D n=1 Tax=Phymastichus coffea TaxID=108790 RepID=UPI00273B8891|nr:probable ATP-dependent RNA helicase Dbp73D [Phymastichus coffea]
MNLFVVNRYEDEEWKKQSNEPQDHLSELFKKIERRKREKEAAAKAAQETTSAELSATNTVAPTVDTNKKGKKKKGKKRTHDISEGVNTTGDLNRHEISLKNAEKLGFQENNAKECHPSVINKADFTILGSKTHTKKQLAKRVLPHWLTHPEIVNADLSSGSNLDEVENILGSKLIEKLKTDGFNKLFPVQVHVLSWLLKCDKDYKAGRWTRDTCISMPTGSGKTLAYVLPIVQLLQNNFVRLVRCLVVLPVQELATQVHDVMVKYCHGTSLRVALISGASSFKDEQERLVQKCENGQYLSRVDIVIATPGRLIDHVKKTDGFSLFALRFLVIDEADRSTDWLQYIPFPHAKPPPLIVENIRKSWNIPAQKILLSATLSQDPEKLSRLGLFRPILFTSAKVNLKNIDKDINLDKDLNQFVSRYGNPSQLTERIIECTLQHKPLALYQLLTNNEQVQKSLVFTNSSEAAHRLAILLQSLLQNKNVTVGELSGQLGSKQREDTLEKFIQGTLQVLVSSDALARGIDVPGIKLVVSYDLPKFVKGYIHRAGRTCRGGNSGTAVSLLQANQTAQFTAMLAKVGKTVPEIEKLELDNVAETLKYENHLKILQNKLSNEQENHLKRIKSRKRKTLSKEDLKL